MVFKKLFGKQSKKQEILLAPLSGRVLPIEQVPDPAFAEKMLGEGVAIEPTEGEVVAPIDGEIIVIAPTKHAIGMRSNQGVEILIHIGLDTVNLQGEGFEVFVEVGNKVSIGQKLIGFSIDFIQQRASSILTPVVITQHENLSQLQRITKGNVYKGETEIMRI